MPMRPDDLWAVFPLLTAVLGGLVVILLDAFTRPESPRKYLGIFALVFYAVMAGFQAATFGREPLFAFYGTVVADDFSRFLGILFAVSAGLSSLLAMGRLPEQGAARGEFYALMLFSTGGASLLAGATDMVTLFIGLECLSIPAYVLAATLREAPRSTEAGFKYFILGAFSTGFLVYGIALIYGAAHSTLFSDIAKLVAAGGAWTGNGFLALGGLMMLVALGFKIGAVPFHMWVPDVYQGAPTPATAFFATAVKSAAFAALVRILLAAFPETPTGAGALQGAGWIALIGAAAVLTMTAANLVALVQLDVKRMLAYSSIAHAGYLLIGLLLGADGASAILFYLAAYTFMTTGAFAVVACFEHAGGGATLEDYAGLGRRHPWWAAALSVFLFSLAGIPPTAGFFAKFYLFKAAVDHGLVGLAVVAVLNSMVSAYYYLRVTVSMYMQESEGAPRPAALFSPELALAVLICLFFILFLGLYPIPCIDAAKESVAALL